VDRRAAVVTSSEEVLIAEPRHHLDLVLRHRAEGIVDGFRRSGADVAFIAAQVGGDDVEFLGGRRSVPGDALTG
jgi:hypothetical protein